MDKLKKYLSSFGLSENEIDILYETTDEKTLKSVKGKITRKTRDFLLSFGFSERETDKILLVTHIRSVELLKSKLEDYKEIFNLSDERLRKMITCFPTLLDSDPMSDSETSIKNKITGYEEILGLSEDEAKELLLSCPSIISYDLLSDKEGSVRGRLRAYKRLLEVNDEELKHMIINSPSLLGFDAISDKSSSIKTKMRKLKEVVPKEDLKSLVVNRPCIFSVPAQSFKIRYMLAVLSNNAQNFLSTGYMTNEKKVWARYCHITLQNVEAGSYFYVSEKGFFNKFGVSSEELMKKYPLDEKAVSEIEKEYLERTGERLVLDQEEREQLGLGE